MNRLFQGFFPRKLWIFVLKFLQESTFKTCHTALMLFIIINQAGRQQQDALCHVCVIVMWGFGDVLKPHKSSRFNLDKHFKIISLVSWSPLSWTHFRHIFCHWIPFSALLKAPREIKTSQLSSLGHSEWEEHKNEKWWERNQTLSAFITVDIISRHSRMF